MPAFLIYGATGYTGQLAAEHAAASGLRPVLAGRNRKKLRTLAGRIGLEWRVFSLDAPEMVREGIKGVAAVLHTAGPFSATSKPMRDACLRSGLHYIDITGELEVFEAVAARAGATANRDEATFVDWRAGSCKPRDGQNCRRGDRARHACEAGRAHRGAERRAARNC